MHLQRKYLFSCGNIDAKHGSRDMRHLFLKAFLSFSKHNNDILTHFESVRLNIQIFQRSTLTTLFPLLPGRVGVRDNDKGS